jgi:hypothetical protein
MGNSSSTFCTSEPSSQCVGSRDSGVLLLIHPSSIGVMLTPAKGHFLTNNLPQRCCVSINVERIMAAARLWPTAVVVDTQGAACGEEDAILFLGSQSSQCHCDKLKWD